MGISSWSPLRGEVRPPQTRDLGAGLNFDTSSACEHADRMRENVTAYDAMYIALAEVLDAPIVTCDAPLAKSPGHRAPIEVIR